MNYDEFIQSNNDLKTRQINKVRILEIKGYNCSLLNLLNNKNLVISLQDLLNNIANRTIYVSNPSKLKKYFSQTSYVDVRCDLYKEEKYYVQGWKPNDKEGKILAKLDLADGKVEYIDKSAKKDEYVQQVIKEMLENGYVLTE